MKKIIYLLVGLIFLSYSCNDDFLEVSPTTDVAEDRAFATPAGARGVITAIYEDLSGWEAYALFRIVNMDVRGDDQQITQFNNWSWFTESMHFQDVPSDSDGSDNMWPQYYLAIEKCNAFLEAELPFTEEVSKKLIAEVKTLEALAYFDLVRMFCAPYAKDNGAIKLKTFYVNGHIII